MKFLTKAASGINQLVSAITASTGIVDADKIPATNAEGKIDSSFFPDGYKSATTSATAKVTLSAGDFVTFAVDGDVILADNSSLATEAKGYVLDSVAADEAVLVYLYGLNTAVTTEVGSLYFLGANGKSSAIAPEHNVGTICQTLGYGTSEGLLFEYNQGVEYA